jgi:transposase, IS5 family
MRRERDAPMNVCDRVPTWSRALDPVGTPWDRVRADDPWFQAVNAAGACRVPRTLRDGRPAPPVEVIWHLLGVKPRDGWRDEATARWVRDRVVWRPCCRVDVASVPEDTTLRRWANLRQPAPLPHRLDHVGMRARSLQVTRGRTLRGDGTVGEPPLPPPTDRTWREEGVRGLGRTLATARAILQQSPAVARDAWRHRTRRAKRQLQRSMEAARPRGPEAVERRRTADQRLLTMTQATVPPAQPVGALLNAQATPPGKPRAATLASMVPRVCQVISQTTRRVLPGAVGPAAAHVVRRCEPPTAIIRQGKPGRPTACGRVVWVEAVEGGMVSWYAVLDGPPAEAVQLPPRLEPHLHVFTRPPRLLTGDGGVHSAAHAR